MCVLGKLSGSLGLMLHVKRLSYMMQMVQGDSSSNKLLNLIKLNVCLTASMLLLSLGNWRWIRFSEL